MDLGRYRTRISGKYQLHFRNISDTFHARFRALADHARSQGNVYEYILWMLMLCMGRIYYIRPTYTALLMHTSVNNQISDKIYCKLNENKIEWIANHLFQINL